MGVDVVDLSLDSVFCPMPKIAAVEHVVQAAMNSLCGLGAVMRSGGVVIVWSLEWT